LRGFTAFTDSAEPEEVERVLRDYHDTMGTIISEHQATVDRFAGDGILIFLNDPFPVSEPTVRAARMALAMQASFETLQSRWSKLGYDLHLGVGIAHGFATLGAFGFEGRWDYSAVGAVVNLASRLCSEARNGQILIDRRAWAALDERAEVEPVGPLALKGYSKPIDAYALKRMLD
jgi:class 3 adenylate cyclase